GTFSARRSRCKSPVHLSTSLLGRETFRPSSNQNLRSPHLCRSCPRAPSDEDEGTHPAKKPAWGSGAANREAKSLLAAQSKRQPQIENDWKSGACPSILHSIWAWPW